MKRVFFCLFIFCTLSFSSNGQNINIGILGGINSSQVSGDGYRGFRKAGILIGLYSDFDVGERLNFQFEINYSQKGSRRNPRTDKGDTDFFLMRMDYVEIPVMLRFKKNKFTYETGLYYAQLANDYLEDENGPFDIPEQLNQFENFDIGAFVGINFNFSENIIMNWRYSNSILPVREFDSGANFRFNSGMFHSYLSFSMRYEFIGNGS